MDIKRNGAQPSAKGPGDWFTGVVRIDPLFQAPDPARVAGASVTFEPGAVGFAPSVRCARKLPISPIRYLKPEFSALSKRRINQ